MPVPPLNDPRDWRDAGVGGGKSQSGGKGSRITVPVSAPPPTRHRVAATTSARRLRGRQMELASGAHIIAVSSLSSESLYSHYTTSPDARYARHSPIDPTDRPTDQHARRPPTRHSRRCLGVVGGR